MHCHAARTRRRVLWTIQIASFAKTPVLFCSRVRVVFLISNRCRSWCPIALFLAPSCGLTVEFLNARQALTWSARKTPTI